MSPYKDEETAREASKERMRKHRLGVTKEGVTGEGVTAPIMHFENGASIHINKLVDPHWRGLLQYLVDNLKPAFQDSIRVGMSGPTVRECKKLLEVTA